MSLWGWTGPVAPAGAVFGPPQRGVTTARVASRRSITVLNIYPTSFTPVGSPCATLPGLIASLRGLLRRRQHSRSPAHHVDVAWGSLPRVQRGKEGRVAQEPPHFSYVDLTDRVWDTTVEITQPGMLREMLPTSSANRMTFSRLPGRKPVSAERSRRRSVLTLIGLRAHQLLRHDQVPPFRQIPAPLSPQQVLR